MVSQYTERADWWRTFGRLGAGNWWGAWEVVDHDGGEEYPDTHYSY